MTDRDPEHPRERTERQDRVGFGDDQGTRVGSPDPAAENPPERTHEHESGYGGEGGEPKTSSDQRESLDR